MSRSVLRQGNRGPRSKRLTRLLEATRLPRRHGQDLHPRGPPHRRGFQARHVDEQDRPLEVDGVVGPLTWWALEEDQPVRPPEIPWAQRMPAEGGSQRGRAALRTAIAEAKARCGA